MESSLAAEQQRILASDWGGGKSPFGTSWSKFMMWIFIISDALTFAGFLIAYGFMRSISPSWPKQTEVFNMVLITFMTFILISSSATMAMAVGAARTRLPGVRVVALDRGRSTLNKQSMGCAAIRRGIFCDHRLPRFPRFQRRNDTRNCGAARGSGEVLR